MYSSAVSGLPDKMPIGIIGWIRGKKGKKSVVIKRWGYRAIFVDAKRERRPESCQRVRKLLMEASVAVPAKQ